MTKEPEYKPHVRVGIGGHRRGFSFALAACIGMGQLMQTKREPEVSTQTSLPDPLPTCPGCGERNMVLIVLERPNYRCERCNKNFSYPSIYESL